MRACEGERRGRGKCTRDSRAGARARLAILGDEQVGTLDVAMAHAVLVQPLESVASKKGLIFTSVTTDSRGPSKSGVENPNNRICSKCALEACILDDSSNEIRL